MADSSDVEQAIAQIVESVRVAQGATWRISRGWPDATTLDTELANGFTRISIWPDQGVYRDTTRFESVEVELPRAAPTLTVSLAGNVATFAGTCSTDQVAGVQKGTTAWDVRCSASDTPTTIAAALATKTGGTSSGAALTLPGIVAARTDRDGSTVKSVRNQDAGFRVIVWAPDPLTRDSVCVAIDSAMAALTQIALPDGFNGVLRVGNGSLTSDAAQNANLYRRDLRYRVDYATTITTVRTPVLFLGVTYAPGSTVIGAVGA